MDFKRLFVTTAAINAATAATNMIGTVLIVRWFGAAVYADYLVDLAYIGLILILLEIVPSNYSVFRVQDAPDRIHGLAALSIASTLVLILVIQASISFFDLYHADSIWMILYAGIMAIKRYLDIRLQSTGRLPEYFGIEFRSAILRIVLLGAFLWLSATPADAVWASLACATLLSQAIWFIGKHEEQRIFLSLNKRSAWMPWIEERRAYLPYYFESATKRVKANLIPILASFFFTNRELLGGFFLAYRGLQFTSGQIRILEGLLNHRLILGKVSTYTLHHRALVAIAAQLACILASIGLIASSGLQDFQIPTVITLSFAIWPYVFFIIERAKAYSAYEAFRVNAAIVAYCAGAAALAWTFKQADSQSSSAFSAVLVSAEILSLATLHFFKQKQS